MTEQHPKSRKHQHSHQHSGHRETWLGALFEEPKHLRHDNHEEYRAAEFRKFKRADAAAHKKRQVTTSVIPLIQEEINDSQCVAGEVPFTTLDHLIDGALVPGNPDVYYGARPEQLHQQVRDELSGQIIPSTQDDLPIVPNFFLTSQIDRRAMTAHWERERFKGFGHSGEENQWETTKPISSPPYTMTERSRCIPLTRCRKRVLEPVRTMS
ncbi:hypothetical protein AAE478_006482 [Parahypoxylon ruwenzoriense]